MKKIVKMRKPRGKEQTKRTGERVKGVKMKKKVRMCKPKGKGTKKKNKS